MRRFLRLFRVNKEEGIVAAVVLAAFLALNILFICYTFNGIAYVDDKHLGDILKHFVLSGFDPLTYKALTEWSDVYNVYRHPLLGFLVYIPSMVNQWILSITGINFCQFFAAIPLLFSAFYSSVFMYRIQRQLLELKCLDATLLTLLLFSFAYVMVSLIAPDHFAFSMFLLIFALYLSGKCIKEHRPLTILQTVLLFLATAGVTLSNGVKIFIDAFCVNGKKFFRPKYLLLAVIIPAALLWIFCRWEYRVFVWPEEMHRKQLKAQQHEKLKQIAYEQFSDTTQIADSAQRAKAFNQVLVKRAQAKYQRNRKMAYARHTGKPIAKGEFMRWTDITTPRWGTAVHNLFGESLQLHHDYLLEDTLRSRPVIVKYNSWYQYAVELLLVLLFVVGIWCGRKSRFLWMCLLGFAFDVALHLGLGFGINEVYIMTAHWAFVIPIAIGFLLQRCQWQWLRLVMILLVAYLWIYNGILLVGFIIS